MVRMLAAHKLASGALLLSLIATACSSSGAQPPAPASAPTSAAGAPTSAAAPAPTAAVGAAAPTTGPASAGGMEIKIATTEPPNLDPGVTSDGTSIGLVMHLFEGLVGQDPKDGTIVPRVAEKWDVSPDGLTYTFHLRDGPKWSDGKPVTAKDFEWAWKRNIDPKTASDYATSLFPVKNAEKIFNDKTLQPSELGVKATDDKTLVVTLEEPAAYFLNLAATWTLMPLRQDTVEKNGDKWVEAANVLTNGPYLMKEWTHDQQIVLEANPNYWGKKPTIQKATFRIFPDGGEDQMVSAFEAGEIDSGGTQLFIPAAQVDRIKADPKGGYFEYLESRTTWLTVNNRRDYLKDPRVRKALGMSLDRTKLTKDVLKSAFEPATSVVPEGIQGRTPDLWPKEDVAGAKKMLADAGFPDGKGLPDLSYAYNTNTVHKLTAEYIQQRWKETLGINLKITNMEWKVLLQWKFSDEWTKNGDMFRGGWGSDYEDANNWYNLLFDSRSDAGQFNTGWKNDQFDKLVRQAAGELNRDNRTKMYADAEKIMADEYPVIPLWYSKNQILVKPYLKGFVPSRLLGVIPLETLTVDPH